MKANYNKGPRQIKTYAERLNALRNAKEVELITYGMEIGMRLMGLIENRQHHIANDRLIHDFAAANYMFEKDFKNDPEAATEEMMAALDKIMGKGWEIKVAQICEKWRAGE